VEIDRLSYEKRWKGVEEWWRKEEVKELGVKRVGWECKNCAWSYWVRVVELLDEDDSE